MAIEDTGTRARRIMRVLAIAALILGVTRIATGADIPVSYLVEQKTLKDAVAGTSLTFDLYTDAGCTPPAAYSTSVDVDTVTVIAKLSKIVPKGGSKTPNVAELRNVLPNVAAAGNLWLAVTGVGVVPFGGSCQAQSAQIAQSTSDPGTLDSKAVVLAFSAGQWGVETPSSVGLPSPGVSVVVVAVDRTAATTLQALDTATRYGCTIELMSPLAPANVSNMILTKLDTNFSAAYIPIFALNGCVPACSDGLRDGKETDVDCGGDTGCARCPNGSLCASGSDCVSSSCGYCTVCAQPVCL